MEWSGLAPVCFTARVTRAWARGMCPVASLQNSVEFDGYSVRIVED